MDTRTIGIVIRREYLNRVRKKSFLVITFVVPLLFAALCILPSVLMMATKEAAKTVAVIDNSGIVLPYLEDTDVITYVDRSDIGLEKEKALIGVDCDVVLNISPVDSLTRSVTAETYSSKPLGMDMSETVSSHINDAVEAYRIGQYDIDNLGEIMRSIESDVHLTTITLDGDGRETITESGIFMVVSMLLGMVIYMFVTMFSGMVMSSVIEEKSSRVVEVLISSVKAIDLMFGKIIGVALVALTQFVLWIVLVAAILGVTGIVLGQDKFGEIMGGGADVSAMADLSGTMGGTDVDLDAIGAAASAGKGNVIIATLANMPVGEILICFVLFFVFGYLLYASMFAAIGSAVENEADSQQLQLPLTVPLLIGFFIALYAFKSPDSQLVFWTSLFPFTSPIVMLARLPFGVPAWELVLSLVLLAGTFVVCAWGSARIYKAGILQFGTKAAWKDLFKWLRM